MCTKEFRVNSGLTHAEFLKRGHLLKHYQIQLYHRYNDFCMIFNAEFIHQHCLTGIPKLETYDESAHGTCMSTDNKRQLILFDVTGLSIENVPRELVTCFREVLGNGGTMHITEPYGEPAPSSSLWPELHMQLHNKTFAIDI